MKRLISVAFITVFTRYVVAFSNLVLLFLNGRVLGLGGMGELGMLLASVNICMLIASILSGNTIVYYLSRYARRYVIVPAYLWSLLGCGMGCLGLWLLGVLPVGLGLEVYVISVLLSLVGIHLRVLLGLERTGSFNVLMLFQGCSLLLLMLFIYGVLGVREVRGYIYGIYAVNTLSWLVSLLIMLRCFRVLGHADQVIPKSLWVYLREVFAYGLWSGADNMAEGLTARLNYFLVERSVGYGGVGLLDAGTRISEGVRHISQGLSQLSYSATARSREKEEQRLISVGYFRITLYLMSILMLLILLIPEWIYTEYLFTVEFVGIRVLIMCLSLGVLSQGCNCIFSHYFIGTGRVRLSAICSLIGLLSLLLSGSILIPCYGVIGSALSTSISFSMMLIYSLIMFTRITGTTLIELFGLRIKK